MEEQIPKQIITLTSYKLAAAISVELDVAK